MYQKDWVRINPKEIINKKLECNLVDLYTDNIIHKSGDIFTEETLNECRKGKIVDKYYYIDEEYMEISPKAAAAIGKKFYRVSRAQYVSYNTYEVWAYSKEEAIEIIDDGDQDPVDSEADDHCDIPDHVDERTKEELEDIEMRIQQEEQRIQREIERLNKRKKRFK